MQINVLIENNAARKGTWEYTSDTSMILALADCLVRVYPLNTRNLSKRSVFVVGLCFVIHICGSSINDAAKHFSLKTQVHRLNLCRNTLHVHTRCMTCCNTLTVYGQLSRGSFVRMYGNELFLLKC